MFLSDDSVQRILVIGGLVILLFGAYLLMVYLSNQSIRRLARRTRTPVGQPARGRLFTQARWVIAILLALTGGLVAMLVFLTRAS